MTETELYKAIEHHYGSGILMAFTDLIHEEREMTERDEFIERGEKVWGKGRPMYKVFLVTCSMLAVALNEPPSRKQNTTIRI